MPSVRSFRPELRKKALLASLPWYHPRRLWRNKKFPRMLVVVAVVWFLLIFQILDPFKILIPTHYMSVDLPSLDVSAILSKSEKQTKDMNSNQDKNKRTYQDAMWESTTDNAEDYRNCTMFGPYPRPRHTCTVDNETGIPYCTLQNVLLDLQKIHAADGGGAEPISVMEEILNRTEESEYLSYEPGAFVTTRPLKVPAPDADRDHFFYMNDVLMATTHRSTASRECSYRYAEPTLFITRYEYVDLYHTVRDWWNAFFAQSTGGPLDALKPQVIFLDAHAQGQYDAVWETLFGRVRFLTQLGLDPEKGVCFNQIVLVPPGYSSVLWPRHRLFSDKCHRCPAMMNAFEEFVLEKHQIDEDLTMVEGRITIVQRKNDYYRHPRSVLGDPTGVIMNWDVLMHRVAKLDKATRVDVVELEKLPFSEQLEIIRQTHILIGNDDMLSHVLFMSKGSHVLDMKGNNGISEYAAWKPDVHYRDIGNFVPEGMIDDDTYEQVIEAAIKDILTPDWDANMTFGMEDDAIMFNGNEDAADSLLWDIHNSRMAESPKNYRDCKIYQPKTKPSHGCILGKQSMTPFCAMSELVVDTSKIGCPPGGEPIEDVMGRDEEEEYPIYQPGAFKSTEEFSFPDSVSSFKGLHYISHVVGNMTQDSTLECGDIVSTPTLFLTRYEYVDLLPTITDWWNTFVMLPPHGNDQQVVFLDGHAEGHFDKTWEQLFGPIQRVMQLPSTDSHICFENVALVPPTYSSMLRPSIAMPCTTLTNAFVDFVLDRLAATEVEVEPGKVVILDKKPFLSHPRLDLKNAQQQFTNLEAVAEQIRAAISNATVEVLRVDEQDFGMQLQAIRTAQILIGHVETDLALLLFLQENTHIIEIEAAQPSHLQDLSTWKANVTHRIAQIVPNDDHEISSVDVDKEILPILRFILLNEDPKSEHRNDDDANGSDAGEAIDIGEDEGQAEGELDGDEGTAEESEFHTSLRKSDAKKEESSSSYMSWFNWGSPSSAKKAPKEPPEQEEEKETTAEAANDLADEIDGAIEVANGEQGEENDSGGKHNAFLKNTKKIVEALEEDDEEEGDEGDEDEESVLLETNSKLDEQDLLLGATQGMTNKANGIKHVEDERGVLDEKAVDEQDADEEEGESDDEDDNGRLGSGGLLSGLRKNKPSPVF